MTVELRSEDLQRFRMLVAHRLGLRFDDSRLGELAEVLRKRLADTSQPPDAYLSRLHGMQFSRDEVRTLASELTVGETYFFRNADQFRAFSEAVLPDRMRVRSERRRLRILSAGCASGEEPYTLGILLSERVRPVWDVSIRAVDLNATALAKAKHARYSTWALRETPAETQRRWFEPRGHELILHASARRFVTFEESNLAEADPDLWEPGAYDVVFCRNVLMYFEAEKAVALVNRIAASLAPGGYLFLGHAETLRGLSQEFHLLHTHGTFYYQRRQPSTRRASSNAEPQAARLAAESAPILPAPDDAATWVETICRASERIHALHAAGVAPRSEPRTGRSSLKTQPWDLAFAVDLLKEERFGEALDRVQALPPEAAMDPDVLLLRATLLAHSGQLTEAERTCHELLKVDDLNAGAHYLLALCREGLGDPRDAGHHDQMAAYLDPAFAMPRLHLGLMARRAGDHSGACRELSEAVELLRREEASRLLLFGGGFSREGLVALCRAELAACGGKA